jgi:hypothetical protein
VFILPHFSSRTFPSLICLPHFFSTLFLPQFSFCTFSAALFLQKCCTFSTAIFMPHFSCNNFSLSIIPTQITFHKNRHSMIFKCVLNERPLSLIYNLCSFLKGLPYLLTILTHFLCFRDNPLLITCPLSNFSINFII